MPSSIYRFEFAPEVSPEEIEASIVLAVLGTEALHGETEVQLAPPHYFDANQRTCVVDGSTQIGRDFTRLLLGFLRREFSTEHFSVRRLQERQVTNGSPVAK